MCQNILKHHQIDPRVRDALRTIKLTPQSASLCREEILARCGIDLSTFLAERERLGKSYKQVLEEIRSFNSSLCLKMSFGIPLSQLGTPHLIRYHILMPHSKNYIKFCSKLLILLTNKTCNMYNFLLLLMYLHAFSIIKRLLTLLNNFTFNFKHIFGIINLTNYT